MVPVASQTELSNRKMSLTMLVRYQPIPIYQYVEGRCREGQPGLQMSDHHFEPETRCRSARSSPVLFAWLVTYNCSLIIVAWRTKLSSCSCHPISGSEHC